MDSKTKKQEPKQGRRAARRAKGTGTLERHGRTWRAVWRTADGKTERRSTGTSDRREAEKILAELVAPYRLKMAAGKDAKAAKRAQEAGLDATANALANAAKTKRAEAGRLSVSVAKAWDKFNSSLARESVSESTARTYAGRWATFEKWMAEKNLGALGLADVDKETAEDFMREIKARFSPKTFNDYRSLLSMVWKVLDEEAGLDGFNPWQRITLLSPDTHVRRELTAEELARVVAPLEGEMRVLFAIGIYTGLRLGDCVNLDWGSVDLVRGFIQLTPRKTKKHGTIVKIPLFPALASILAETPARQRRGRILPELAAECRGRNTHFSERVRRVFEDAGIETQSETARGRKAVEVGFHSLRHTFVSLCANEGVPLSIVQAIVGHTNAAMTTHYFHVSDDALRGAVAALPDVFRVPAALPAPGEMETIEAEVVDAPTIPQDILDGLARATAAQLEAVRRVLAEGEKMKKGGDK